MQSIFGTAPITGAAWLRVLAIALTASVVISVEKRRRRRRGGGHPARPGQRPAVSDDT